MGPGCLPSGSWLPWGAAGSCRRSFIPYDLQAALLCRGPFSLALGQGPFARGVLCKGPGESAGEARALT
jgi:hypothetical protein